MPQVDFSNVESGLEPGSYVGIVKGVNYQTDEKKGVMLTSFSVVIDGSERRTKLYQMEGKGLFFLYQALVNMGVDVPKGPIDIDELPIQGLKAEFEIKEREYNGKKYRDLEPVKPLGKATDEEMIALQSGAPF